MLHSQRNYKDYNTNTRKIEHLVAILSNHRYFFV
nr:MAG TPA: hypothetical protein [Caudoviricetes sp.]